MRNFDIESVAARSTDDVEELAQYTRVIRNRRKLAAIIQNACQIIDLDEEHTGFANYLRSGGSYELTVKDLRKQFKFMGERWVATIFCTSLERTSRLMRIG